MAAKRTVTVNTLYYARALTCPRAGTILAPEREAVKRVLRNPRAAKDVGLSMVATRFAVAVHIALILSSEPAEPATSHLLARSIHTNPVVIRRINGMLVRAGIVKVRRGPGGATLARPPGAITLADIWRAVNNGDGRPVFPLHGAASAATEHDSRLRASLGRALARAEGSLKEELSEITLAEMIEDARQAA